MFDKIRAAYRKVSSLFFLLLLTGCAATPQTDRLVDSIPESLVKPVELTQVPFFPQEQYQCGPAALATLLSFQGQNVDLNELTRQIYIPERKGSLQLELITASRSHG